MNTYYKITGTIDGHEETLFGSFDKSDCTFELDSEKQTWKDEGFRKLKITNEETEEKPDPEVYFEKSKTTCIKITFFNTVPHKAGDYTIHRSTTEKAVFLKIYKTENVKRAFSYAKRFINKQSLELGRNTCTEVIENHRPVKPRSWLDSNSKSFGGALLRQWYIENPEFIDQSK